MDNLIFIIGCGHSGTTILNKIIGNHKNIYGLDYETSIFEKLDDNGVLNKLSIYDNNRKSVKKKWICEKTPRHTYHLARIYKLANKPKIIIVVRDGRDVIASLFKRYMDFDKSINRWINDNFEWINYFLVKNNADLINNENFHLVKYENFVSNPEIEIKKVCDFIKEEYDDNMLNYKKEQILLPKNILKTRIDGKEHNLLRLYQINQDIYDGSGRYQKDLTEIQLNKIYSNENFIYLMKLFDYL
jgi:hypothetical protein